MQRRLPAVLVGVRCGLRARAPACLARQFCKPTDLTQNVCPGDFVVNNNMDADQGMAEFRLTCLQPPPPPPGESCTPLAGEQADERVFDPCVCAGDTNGDFAVTSTDILNGETRPSSFRVMLVNLSTISRPQMHNDFGGKRRSS